MGYVEERYAQWIRDRLPAFVPVPLAEQLSDISLYGEVIDLNVWVADPSPAVIYTARDEEELLVFLYDRVCARITDTLAEEGVIAEKARWRYVPATDEKGELVWQEQANYTYNTIWRPEKARNEICIALAAAVQPWANVEAFIDVALAMMNRFFPDHHWGFDRRRREFVEISDSRDRALDQHPILPPIAPGKEE